jgi:hypothetical protein
MADDTTTTFSLPDLESRILDLGFEVEGSGLRV